MAGYLAWVALTALVVAFVALGVGLLEMRKRRRHDRVARGLYEAMQGCRLSPTNPFQEKWAQEIKKHEASPTIVDQSTRAP